MPEPRPIAVVGAGIVGAACARALQRDGRRVLLIDRDPPGKGCSYGNAGHIAIDHIRPLSRPDVLLRVPRMLADPLGPLAIRWRHLPQLWPWLARFALAARPGRVKAATSALASLLESAVEDWRAEAAASGARDLFRWQGALVVYETARAFRDAEAERQIQCRHGVVVKTLTGEEARDMAPGLTGAVQAATFYPQAAHVVDPHRLVTALVDAFAQDGGTVERAHVRGFAAASGDALSLMTDHGPVEVEAAVIAAGLGSKDLVREAGLSAPMAAERGYHLMLDATEARFDVPVSSAERGFVLTPMATGLRLAGTVELADPSSPPFWARAELLEGHARALFPGLGGSAGARWVGSRPTLPDYLPAIGRVPGRRNLFMAFGHQHLGLTLAATTGRLVADLVADRPAPLDLRPFAPDRFTRGRRPARVCAG